MPPSALNDETSHTAVIMYPISSHPTILTNLTDLRHATVLIGLLRVFRQFFKTHCQARNEKRHYASAHLYELHQSKMLIANMRQHELQLQHAPF